MAYKVTAGPGADAFDLTELKDHLKVENSDEDTLITNMGKGAQNWLEEYLGIKLITQTIEEYYDYNQFYRGAVLSVGPVASITDVDYLKDNVTTEWDINEFKLDTVSYPGRLTLLPDKSRPTIDKTINAVWVTYTVGYGASRTSVPQVLRDAIHLRASALYTKREDHARRYRNASVSLVRNFKI